MPGPIAKPVMRGMHIQYVKRGLFGAAVAAVVSGLAFKIFVMDARRKTYDEFWATYDVDAAVERLNKSGFMASAPQNLGKNK